MKLKQSVFVSYRRGIDDHAAGALARDLKEELGDDAVFLDVENLAENLGIDFHELLEQRVAQCTTFLAVIGRGWKEAMPRLESEDDWVRMETAVALNRKGLRVIPVLIGGEALPAPEDLPDALKTLVRRQFLTVRHTDWNHDLSKLLAVLQTGTDEQEVIKDDDTAPGTVGGIAKRLAIAGLAAIFVMGGAYFFREEIIHARCSMVDQPWEFAYCG